MTTSTLDRTVAPGAPRPYQLDAMTAARAAWNGERRPSGSGLVRRILITIATGGGKGHPLDTEVPTPQGLRLWGDLVVGDQVYGSDGAPTTVTAIHDRGILPTFRVTFRHGESVLVDGDHLWDVQRKGRQRKVVSTQWLMSQPMQENDGGYRWAIPVTGAVRREKTDLPLDPYLVGALIANGGMTHGNTILTTPDRQVISRLQAAGVDLVEYPAHPRLTCPRFGVRGVSQATRALGMRVHSRDKRIPRAYLEASIDDRVALLQALMVSDGGVRHGGRRSVEYFTTSSGLADDVCELVTSLGGTSSICTKDRRHEGKPVEYRLAILLPVGLDVFDTDRKVADSAPRKTFHPRRVIVSIEPVEAQPIRCISVSAPDHLYLITRNHIVTHNTWIFSHMAKEVIDAGGRVLVLVHREDLAVQAFNHLHSAAPGANVGMVMGPMFNNTEADIIVASVPTLVIPSRREQLPEFDLVIADEAHLSPAPGWSTVLEHVGCLDGRTRLAGFTATPYREDGKPLVGTIFEENVFTWDIVDGIRSGWLSDLDARRVRIRSLDLLKVSAGRGEMSAEDLGDAMLDADAGPEIVEAYLHPTDGGLREDGSFRPFLLFTPDVATAVQFAADFAAAGIPVETITGETPGQCRARMANRPQDCCGVCRQASYDRYRAGETVGLVNCVVLTVGFDMPMAEVAIIARATTSRGLYRQMVGRITRKSPGKLMGRIIDVIGVTDRIDLAGPVDILGSDVDEGETFSEALERKEKAEQEEVEPEPAPRSRGEQVVETVELFEQSASMFLQSPKGYWFVPVTNGLYYLQPLSSGLFSVCRLPQKGKRIRKEGGKKVTDAVVLESRVTEEWGKRWIESYATEEDPSISSKSAAWRSKKDPSAAQVEFLQNRGYEYPEDFETRSEASNLMSQIIAGWQGL